MTILNNISAVENFACPMHNLTIGGRDGWSGSKAEIETIDAASVTDPLYAYRDSDRRSFI
jgi:hypothetical protein